MLNQKVTFSSSEGAGEVRLILQRQQLRGGNKLPPGELCAADSNDTNACIANGAFMSFIQIYIGSKYTHKFTVFSLVH